MPGINPYLLKVAIARLTTKAAFVPSDQAAGAAPQPDPAMMAGGGGPGGAAPPDPSAGGGGAPPDSMPVGPPAGPGPADAGGTTSPPPGSPDLGMQVQQAVQQAMAAAGGGAGGAGAKPPKPDINTIATDVFQLKKLILHNMRMDGKEVPMDILDGPNRDPSTGMPVPGADQAGAAPQGGAGGAGGGAPPGGQPPFSMTSPINLTQLGGGGKQAAAWLCKQAGELLTLWDLYERHLAEKAAAATPTALSPAAQVVQRAAALEAASRYR
jgi:hypothetical protein